MTTSREQRPRADGSRDATAAGLEQENAQLRQAVDSHATVDRAIGVLTAHQIPPTAGFEVLRELSQHTDIKLRTVAEALGAGAVTAGAGGPGMEARPWQWQAAPRDGFHVLRHTYASIMLEAGESVVTVARWLGQIPGGTTHLKHGREARRNGL